MSVDVRPSAAPPDVPTNGHVEGHVVLGPRAESARVGRRRRRPNLTGDLRALLEEAPSFRRSLRGYDRLQVDNYVGWAEEELATDARTLEDLLQRHGRLRADLDEARRQLHHSASGREFLQLSSRVGAVLCVAADEAEKLRDQAAAEAERVTARAAGDAQRVLDEATAEAERISAEATAEASARLTKSREIQRRTDEAAASTRERARREADGAVQAARVAAAQLLAAADHERARKDREAAAARDRLDREAQARRQAAEKATQALERRCSEAHTYLDRMSAQVAEVLTSLGNAEPSDAGPSEAGPHVERRLPGPRPPSSES